MPGPVHGRNQTRRTRVVCAEDGYDEVFVLNEVGFSSVCEHHLLEYFGPACVACIARAGKIVGISKLAGLVECFAGRLQIQEQMTEEIANALQEHLEPL